MDFCPSSSNYPDMLYYCSIYKNKEHFATRQTLTEDRARLLALTIIAKEFENPGLKTVEELQKTRDKLQEKLQ